MAAPLWRLFCTWVVVLMLRLYAGY